MTKEFLEKQFKLFLKENNISFDYYKHLNSNYSETYKRYTDLLNDNNYKLMIVKVFPWCHTREGFSYWDSIHYKWINVCKDILKGQELYYDKDENLYND